MNISLIDLVSEAVEAAKAGGISRSIALDYAARAIQKTDADMPYVIARRIASELLPDVDCSLAA